MPIDLPVIILIAIVALVVAATAAQRAGDHADLKAGRPIEAAHRFGPFGAVVDVLDQSVAAYLVRSRLGRSTLTRPEREVEDQRAAAVAYADEIRRQRGGVPEAHAPKRLVVAGSPAAHAAVAAAPMRSTLSVELLAAGLGLAVVVLVVIGIWPREDGTGAVLSATGTPAPSAVSSPSPSVQVTLPP
jgi:hypothetical protein